MDLECVRADPLIVGDRCIRQRQIENTGCVAVWNCVLTRQRSPVLHCVPRAGSKCDCSDFFVIHETNAVHLARLDHFVILSKGLGPDSAGKDETRGHPR